MATQTGSIDLSATNAVHLYAEGEYATKDELTEDYYAKSDFTLTPSQIATKVTATEKAIAGSYATSSTAAGTAAKAATITPAVTGWELYEGAAITVKFTTANTTSAPTLNVDSTGAKAIRNYAGSALTEAEYKWPAGACMSFVYDGTYWRMQDSTALVRMASAESSITQTKDSITSLVALDDTYTAPDGTTATNSIANAIQLNAEGIALRATKEEVDKLGVGGRNYVTEKVNGYLQNGKVLALANASSTYNERTTTFIAVTAGEVLDMEVWLNGADSSQPWIAYHFLSDSTTVLTNRVAKYGTAGDTYIAYKGVEVPTGATLVRMSWRENSTGARAQLTKDTDSSIVRAEATLEVHADQIDARVEKDGVIAAINASVEEEGGSAVKISANKVNIEGAAIFTSGRLSQTSLDNASYKSVKPNLSPYFSYKFHDTDYWSIANAPSKSSELGECGTQLADGWMHVEMDNSERTSGAYLNIFIKPQEWVKNSQTYTWLVEVRNLVIHSGSKVLFRPAQNNASAQTSQDAPAEFTEDGTAYVTSVTRADATTGEYTTFSRGWIAVSAGVSASFDARLSVYEGEYSGPYKPFVDSSLRTDMEAAIDNAKSYADDAVNLTRAWYAECPTAAATGQKAATISPATTAFTTDVLTPGTTVYVKFTNTNSAAANSLYLNVNQTGDYPIKYIYNGTLSNIPGVGYLKANQTYQFYFDGTYWVVEMIYNTNDNTTAYQVNFRNSLLAGEALVTASIIGAHEDGKFYGMLEGTSDYFVLSAPLIWLTADVNSGAANYANVWTQVLDRNLATHYNDFTGTKNSIVYLVGTVSGNRFYLNGTTADDFLTCTVPTTANGLVYIPIGRLGNQSNGKNYLNYAVATPITIFAYIDGGFRQATPTDIIATQRIYYRTTAAATLTGPTTWVDTATNVYGSWTTKVPPLAASTADGQTKYPYLYTCEQRRRIDGTVSCTAVTLDENTTVIDGGNIITHSITATQINADSVKANIVQTTTLLADQMQTNVVSAIQAVVSDLQALVAKIGGFTINATSIFSGSSVTGTGDGDVALSSADFTRSIGGTSRSNLRLALGGKFGVDKQGNLFANGATLTNLTVGGADSNVYSKTEADTAIGTASYQASQPNLSPFFEMPQGNLYNATTNPSGYWRRCEASSTSLVTTWDFGQTTGDGSGWAHIEANNTSSGAAYGYFWVSKDAQALKPSTDYTFLIEWRDVTLSGNVSVQCPTAHGGTNGSNDDFFTSTETTLLTAGSGSAHVTATTRASYESACVCLVRAQVALPENATLSGYIRVSLYEGEYSGPYKPYSGATLYASHTDLDSMEIGGRNLLRHSDKLEDAIWWVRRNVSTIQTGQTDPSGNLEAVKVTPSSTDWYLANRKPMPKLTEVGAPYTASVWLKADSETTCNLCVRYLKSDWVDGNTDTSTTRKTVIVTTEWQRFSVTGTLMTAVTNDHAFWIGQATNAALYAYHPKLERGTKATDWTPAPEDADGTVESGTNLLYDADAPTLDPVNGPAARYFSDSGNASFMACDIRQVENPPETGIRNMAHWSVTGSQVGKYRGLCFYNGSYIQFLAGQTYTASCWVRCTSGKFDARIGAYSGSITVGTGLTSFDSSNGTGWVRWTTTFKAAATKLDRIYFIAITVAGALDFEADMCGFRLVAGDSAESVQSNLTATRSWYAECATAAGTAAKTATISPATTAFTNDILTPGTTVYVKFSNTNTATIGNVTLSVNGTEAKGIRYLANGAYGNLPAANYIRANQILALTYDGTYWVTDLSYNSNTNNYDRRLHNSYILAAGNVASGTFACGTASGYRQVAANVTFDLSYPILYAAAAWTSGTQYANGYEAIPGIDPNTTTSPNTVEGVAVNKTVYLKGTVSGNMFTVAASNFLTCTVPTTEDGYCYIPLGIIANDATTKMYFSSPKDIYAYKDGAFGPVSIREAAAAGKTATDYITNISENNGIWVTPPNAKPNASGAETSTTTGWHISSALDLIKSGVSMFRVWLDSNVTKVRIGDASGRHILMDGTSVSLMNVAATLAKFAASGIEFLNGAATLSAESVETEIQEGTETFTRHRTSIELTNTAVDGMTAGVRAWSQEDVYDDGPMQGTAIDEAVAQLIAGDGAALVGVDSEGSLAVKGDQLAVTYPEWDESTGESTDRTVNATVEGFATAVIGGIVLHEGTYNNFVSSAVTLKIDNVPVSAADFSRLLIEYEDSTGRRGSVVVDDPNGKTFTMQTTTANSSTGFVMRTKTANISGQTVNTSTYSQGVYQYGKVTIGTNGSVTWASAQEIAIVKVIGFY